METEEIELINSWIDSQKPESGTNPLSSPPLDKKQPIGRIGDNEFSRYVGSTRFDQLPISKKTKGGLKEAGYVKMTDIQRASLPHSLCGRDILGAAKTGSGKTLAFVIPVSCFYCSRVILCLLLSVLVCSCKVFGLQFEVLGYD